jgi:hypothetical protein
VSLMSCPTVSSVCWRSAYQYRTLVVPAVRATRFWPNGCSRRRVPATLVAESPAAGR